MIWCFIQCSCWWCW